MLRQIKVTELCKELEEKLVGLQYSEDSLRRYRKVFREFEEYAGDCDYSQSRGTDFLLWKFKQLGGFVTSGEELTFFSALSRPVVSPPISTVMPLIRFATAFTSLIKNEHFVKQLLLYCF